MFRSRLNLKSILLATGMILFVLISTSVTAQDYYWVGGTGAWGDISHWALTSGGTDTPAQLPDASNTAIFDENSFISALDTVYIDNLDVTQEYCLCNDLIFDPSAVSMSPTIAGMTPLQIHGSMELIKFEDLHWLFQGIIEFRSSSAEIIRVNETFFNGNMIFLGSGQWTLLDDLFVDANIFLQTGTLNTNSVAVSCDKFFSTLDSERTLIAGASSFYINKGGENFVWDIENSENFTLDAGSSTLIFTHNIRSRMLAGEGLTYNDIVFPSKIICGDIVAQSCNFNSVDFTTSANISGNSNIFITTECSRSFTLNGTQNRFEQEITVGGNVDILNGSNYFHNFYFKRFLSGNPNIMTLQPDSTQTFDGEGLVLIGLHDCVKTTIRAGVEGLNPSNGHAIVYSDEPLKLSLTSLSYLHAKNSLDPTGVGICQDTASVSVNDNCINWDFSDAVLTIDSVLVENVQPCSYSKNGELTLYISGLKYETQYSIDGTNWRDTPFFQYLEKGEITVYFRQEIAGVFCFLDFTYTTTIGGPPVIEINDILTENVLCNGASDGSITILATVDNTIPNDTLAVEYSINWGSGNTFQSSNVFEDLYAGSYCIMVRDENGCYYGYDGISNFDPICVEITEPELLSATAILSMVSCSGANDGQISVSPLGGVPPYLHNWSNGEIGFEISNLFAGSYTDTIRDQNGCIFILTNEITEPDPLQLSFEQGAVAGPPVSFWAEAVVSGGTPPYTHHWNDAVVNYGNTINSNPVTQLISGMYIDSVRDANGCYVIDTVFLEALSVSAIASKIDCYGGNSGSVEAFVHGGDTPYTYAWYALPENTLVGTTQAVNNLPAGVYRVDVSDITFEIVSATVEILQPLAPISATINVDSISCHNQTDGAINLIVTGGTPFQETAQNYNYLWYKNGIDMGVNAASISSLEAASYSVIITDSLECVFIATVELINPEPLSLTHTIGNDACTSDGYWIAVNVAGGTEPYSYLWSELGETSNTISNLSGGEYSVIVTDYHGCVLYDTFNLVGFESAITHHNVSCFGSDDGWAKVSVSSNSSFYNYSWLPTTILGANSDSIYQLSAGKYYVQITDESSCVFVDSVEIAEPEILNFENVTVQHVIGCYGNSNGSIEVVVSGGTPNYQYSIDDGISWQSAPLFANLAAGNYLLKARDTNLCEQRYFDNPVVVNQPEILVFESVTAQNPLCSYSNDGSILVTAIGGTGGVCFSIDNGVIWSTVGLFNNLQAGAYLLKIRDENGCESTYPNNPVVLVAPNSLAITFDATDPTCNGCSDGEITANPSGGTPPYSHKWGSGEFTQTIQNLEAGVWFVDSVTDAHGCIVVDSVMLYEPQELNFAFSSENVKCFGGNSGSAAIIPNGGTRPYAIQWSKKPSPTIISTDTLIENIDAGLYYVLLTDLYGNSVFDSVLIEQPDLLTIDFELSADTICREDSTAWVVAKASGGTPPYFYFWSDGSYFVIRPDSVFALHADTYQLEVVDMNGCSVERSVKIEAFERPLADFTAENICYGNTMSFYGNTTLNSSTPDTWFINYGDGESAVEPDKGALPFATHLYASAGTYQVELFLMDSNGCLSDTILKEVEVKIIPTAIFTSDTACFGNSSHIVDGSEAGSGIIEGWNWRFPNGNSTVQNPEYIFQGDGLQEVTLTVVNTIGCYDSITASVLVDSLPIPNFVSDNVCFGTLQFTDLSNPNGSTIEQWNWNLGDGFSATIQNPAHTYQYGDQEYDIQLIVTNNRACSDSITKSLLMPSWVDADFTWDTVCVGMSTSFIGLIFNGEEVLQSLHWTFGDGAIASGQNVDHIYFQPGTYVVTLEVLDTLGCSMEITHDIVVSPPHITSFTYSPSCQNEMISFFGSSSSSNIDEWLWDFGDGATSEEQNPQHIYLYPGNYLVNLSTWDENGCFSQQTEGVLVTISPNALFSYENACDTKTISFFNQSIAGYGNITSSYWEFGDGESSDEIDPQHLYASSGTFEVSLLVTNSNGCSSSILSTIVVNADVVAEFVSDSACYQQSVFFEDISSSLGGGTTVARKWLFGDGYEAENLVNVSHIYQDPGLYEASLIIENSFGCTDTSTNIVQVFDPPTLSFNYETAHVCLGDTVFFNDQNATTTGEIINWSWCFGDPNSNASNLSSLPTPSHLYAFPGVYLVTLVITSDYGCVNQYQKQVEILPPPVASFQASEVACSNDTIWFTDFSSSQIGSIVDWYWDFGNGQSSTLQHPYHLFEGAVDDTTYFVRLTVWNNFGCSDTLTKPVFVFGYPTADFFVENSCSGQNTVFTDLSSSNSGAITSWEWSFGDGGSSALQNPTHLYTLSGDYEIELIATTDNGCSDTAYQQLTVFAPPEPNFSADTVCSTDTTYFVDQTSSDSEIVSWSWDFGDPDSGADNFSSLQNPVHKFSDWGAFDVKLVVINSNNCTDSITLPVYTRRLPIADFMVENSACIDNPVLFMDETNFIYSAPYSWTWNFGDGASQTIVVPENPDVSHVYDTFGTFEILLIVENNFGCIDSVVHIIEIMPKPEAGFVWYDSLCSPGYVQFVDTSSNYGNEIMSREWYPEYPNSVLLSGENPSYVYGNTDTTYVAMLVITSYIGCKDTIFESIYIKDPFGVYFTASEECFGNATQFTAEVSSPENDSIISYFWNFGDNTTSEIADPTHLYAVSGQYNVWLQAANSQGCLSQTSKMVSVQNKPVAAFSVLPAGCSDLSLFEDNSLWNGEEPYSWYYNFGDGTDTTLYAENSTGSLFHAYPPYAEDWQIVLIVENILGCSDTVFGIAERSECLTVDFLQINTTCGSRLTFFENTSDVYGVDTEVTQTNWYYGDGTFDAFDYFKDTTSHIYEFAGTYNLLLVVVAESNGSIIKDSVMKVVDVKSAPNAEFSFGLGCEGSAVAFENMSDPLNSTILSTQWFFGDGYTSANYSPEHIFSDEGVYETALVVVSTEGCSDTVVHQVAVHPAAKQFLSVDKEVGCNGYASFHLEDTTSQEKAYYRWGLGDGQFVTTLEDTISTYLHTGEYALSLETETQFGCKAFDTVSVSVFESPEALFTHFPDSVSIQEPVITFYDNSISMDGSIENYFWRFGDHGSAYGEQIEWDFPDTGWYRVTEYITTEHGCQDSVSEMVRVYPQFYCWIPNAFSPNGDGRNDIFEPILTFSSPQDFAFTIFDKWGGVLYSTNTVGESWSGKTNSGKSCPSGTYTYMVLVTDPHNKQHIYKGALMLMR